MTKQLEIEVPEGYIGMLGGVALNGQHGLFAVTVIGPYQGTYTVTDGAFCGWFPVEYRREVEQAYLQYPNCLGCTLSEFSPNR